MENKLEELLNSLIKRGRVSFGDEKIHSFEIIYVTGKIWNIVARRGRGQVNTYYSIREVVSKESGLWQFVCENGMIKNEKLTHTRISQVEWGLDVNCVRKTTSSKYDFRLLESALRDEPELESFILDNIKL